MAVENLSEEIEKAERERNKRYPLLDLANDLEIIRVLSERTIDYSKEMYSEFSELDMSMWAAIPRMAMELMRQYYIMADSKKSTENCVMLHIGDFMEVGVEFGVTPGADKDATFNPIIVLGPELLYDNENPDNNKLRKEPPVIPVDDQEQLDTVVQRTYNVLKSRYGLLIEKPDSIYKLVFNFFRITKDWLIEHKDDDDHVDVDLGNILDIGIEKSNTHELDYYDISASSNVEFRTPENDDEVDYCIQFGPGQEFKLEHSKGDDITEKNNK